MRIHAPLALALALALPAAGSAATWEADVGHSTVQFAVRHLMISTVRGEFHTFAVRATGDPANPAGATVEATIDAKTIDTRHEKRDAHLRNADFLDVEKFPTITFKSTKIEKAGEGKAKVTGDLTLHGVTKPVVLDVEGPTAVIKDPWGNTKVGARATARINRKDFGIDWNKAMDGGGILVGEEIDITIDVEAQKKSD
jgi:polyisoprenoid-binding protein YceI